MDRHKISDHAYVSIEMSNNTHTHTHTHDHSKLPIMCQAGRKNLHTVRPPWYNTRVKGVETNNADR